MSPAVLEALRWGAAALAALAFAGCAYTIIRSLGAGAAAYTDSMSEETARRFEDMFLFVSAKRIADIGRAAAAAASS